MASILKQGLALALVVLIVGSLTFSSIQVAEARIPYNHARQLASNCNEDPFQGEISGCGGGGGSDGQGPPSGPAPGSSRCKNGCCGENKMGECICCN